MLTIHYGGDIFAVGANVLVNPVNCLGISGKGLALTFKERWPSNYGAYKDACLNGECAIGKCFFTTQDDGLQIANLPTKVDWRDPSRLEYVEAGIVSLKEQLTYGNKVAIPALGCGLGGLDVDVVERLLITQFKTFPLCDVHLCL